MAQSELMPDFIPDEQVIGSMPDFIPDSAVTEKPLPPYKMMDWFNQIGDAIKAAVTGPGTIDATLKESIMKGEGYPRDKIMQTPLIQPGNIVPETSPILKGAAEALGGFTSPSGGLLLGATAGVGAAPKIIGRMISAGFSADMLHGLYNQYGEFKKAVDAGDEQTAKRILGQALVTGPLAGLTAFHALKPGEAPITASATEKPANLIERPLEPPKETLPDFVPDAEVAKPTSPPLPDFISDEAVVNPETVRLYRGKVENYPAHLPQGGQRERVWFSTDEDVARIYGKDISSVDVPKSVFEEARIAANEPEPTWLGDKAVLLDKQWADKAVRSETKVALPDFIPDVEVKEAQTAIEEPAKAEVAPHSDIQPPSEPAPIEPSANVGQPEAIQPLAAERQGEAGGIRTDLLLNPLQPVADLYTKHVGEPLYNLATGLIDKMTPEFIGRYVKENYGLTPEYVEAKRTAKIKGELGAEKGLELGKKLVGDFSQEEQQSLGRMIKGEVTEAEVSKMRSDPVWNTAIEAAKQARAELDTLGGEAVMQDLLKQDTFVKNYGKYLPRLYRRYELDYEGTLKKFGITPPDRLELSRFKERKDIPENVRTLMGEILEPGYLVAKGVAQLTHDVEMGKFFKWVADKASTDLASLSPKDPSKIAEMQLPETPRLGALSGMHVTREIYDDLTPLFIPKSEVTKMGRALMSEWKFGKVVLNPSTHARNMMSNTILNWLGGMPPSRLDIYSKALFDIAHEGPMYKMAKENGLFGGTYSKAEFEELLDGWNKTSGSLWNRMGDMANHLRPSQTKAGRAAANLYQGEEAWFKTSKMMHNLEKGMSPKEAVADAQHWLFDYGEVSKFVDWARHSPVGAPFFTFTAKALPVIIESAIKSPWRIGAITYLLYQAQQYSAQKLGINEDELRKLYTKILPEKLKGQILGLPKNMLLPWKDKYDHLQFIDLTYILPWGDVGETGAAGWPNAIPLLSGPIASLYEVKVNKSNYTGKEIYKSTDTTQESTEKIMGYLWRMAVPSLLPGGYGFERIRKAATGEEDYFGRTSSVPTALASSLAGLKTTPVDTKWETIRRAKDLKANIDLLKIEAFKIRANQGMSKEDKVAELEKIKAKMRTAQQEYKSP